jgi:hypothetical protein
MLSVGLFVSFTDKADHADSGEAEREEEALKDV